MDRDLKTVFFILLIMLLFMEITYGSSKEHEHVEIEISDPKEKEIAIDVGVDEKPGEFVDFNTVFFDEKGKRFSFKKYMDRPVVILPAYYYCPKTCSIMIANLANILNKVNHTPGKDYKVITLSFSDDENFEMAAEAKKNYFKLLKRTFPEKSWKFLTGDRENIKKFTDSVGFRFTKRAKNIYSHPNVLIVAGPDGKIIRYLYGPSFLPFDVGMAISEAEKGLPGISIKKVISYCFDYDPKNKKYVFKTFRIAGTVIILLLVVFFIFLVLKPGRKRVKRS